MKEIKLSNGMVTIVNNRDFKSLSKMNWHASKGRNTWYAITNTLIKGKKLRMHSVLMNPPKGVWVDHKDSDGLNNRRKNLRLCTPQQNEGNSRMKSFNTSGIKGVSWCKRDKKWAACICINYKTVHLGRFANKEDAASAYRAKASQVFGEFFRP